MNVMLVVLFAGATEKKYFFVKVNFITKFRSEVFK